MEGPTPKALALRFGVLAAALAGVFLPFFFVFRGTRDADVPAMQLSLMPKSSAPVLDTEEYDRKMRQLAHVDDAAVEAVNEPAKPRRWPVTAAYPNYGAI